MCLYTVFSNIVDVGCDIDSYILYNYNINTVKTSASLTINIIYKKPRTQFVSILYSDYCASLIIEWQQLCSDLSYIYLPEFYRMGVLCLKSLT